MNTQTSSNGVVVAPLGPRLGAVIIDRSGPALIGGAWWYLSQVLGLDGWLIYSVAAVLLLFAWVMVQWWGYATRKAGFGYRVFKLELVGLADGKPIGWGRMALRTLILYALWALVLPGIIMAVFLVIQERRQGWHDRAVGSLAIARIKRETPVETVTQNAGRRPNSTVGLPPHLTGSSFAQPDEQPAAPISQAPISQVPGISGGFGQPSPEAAQYGPQSAATPYGTQPDAQPAPWGAPSPAAPQQPWSSPSPAAPQQWGSPSAPPQPAQQVPAQPYQPQPAAPAQPAPWQPAQPPQAQPPAMPYGQPTQPDPYGQPTPYGAPAQQPYGQPTQPDPYTGPAQPYGQPSPAPYAAPAQPAPYGAPAPAPSPYGQPSPAPYAAPVQPAQPAPQQPAAWAPVTQPPVTQPPAAQPSVPSPAVPQPVEPVSPPVRIKPRQAPNDDADGTRLVAHPSRGGVRPADEGWHVRLDDGRDVPVNGLVLIGRSPQARDDEQGASLLAAGEPGRTVSKTHLALGVDARGPYVVDRGSTNGTALLNASGELEPCPANSQIRLTEGQVVSFGERQLQVLRYPARRD